MGPGIGERGQRACGAERGAGLVEALRPGPDRAEPRRLGPAEERVSGPGLRFGLLDWAAKRVWAGFWVH